MSNTERRIRYLMANKHISLDEARERVRRAYRDGLSDEQLGLKPAQCRRISHSRGGRKAVTLPAAAR